MKQEKKPLIDPNVAILPNLQQEPVTNFITSDFDKAISNHGYNVYIEKALNCPCKVRDMNQADPQCENCGGLGLFFVEKRKTKAVIQGVANNKKTGNWSETNEATSRITTYASMEIGWMDKITILDLKMEFIQVIYPMKLLSNPNEYFSFLIYQPEQVSHVYAFNGLSNPLRTIENYRIEKNRIVFDNSIGENAAISIRYKHNPVYNVISIPREISSSQSDEDFAGIVNRDDFYRLPCSAIGRRTHYIYDAPDANGARLFDNTKYE